MLDSETDTGSRPVSAFLPYARSTTEQQFLIWFKSNLLIFPFKDCYLVRRARLGLCHVLSTVTPHFHTSPGSFRGLDRKTAYMSMSV